MSLLITLIVGVFIVAAKILVFLLGLLARVLLFVARAIWMFFGLILFPQLILWLPKVAYFSFVIVPAGLSQVFASFGAVGCLIPTVIVIIVIIFTALAG